MTQFVNLCFEGGGVKGIAYAGALKVLEERGVIPDIRRVAGTSAGAISAALVALGADWEDVKDIVGGTNFRKFMDDSWGNLRDIARLVKEYGWFKGDAFSAWMKKQVGGLVGNKNLTFKDLKEMAATDPAKYKELTVIGTNLTLQVPETYNAESTPDMRIWESVRISMSIPFFFASAEYEDDDVLVDGGVTWNYPLDIFDRRIYLSDSGNTDTFTVVKYPTHKWDDHIYNKETLGLRVDTKDEIAALKLRQRMPPVEIDNIAKYIKSLIGFMNDMANKAHLHKNDWQRTVFIDALGVGTTDFDLDSETVNALVKSGEDNANAYFKWLDNASPDEALNKITGG
ncbi:patatin [Pseudodesulfovibrio cashew]|uniref:Patatin n=1 Tax=Pseudodesulfovibrio cashew TaxID=2678688 RepID=A0A6I6JF80_9BACT|nr:patatin-like phospholipase family protein [Pseudodesulfovibrio cashew]QGY39062.1 patatin [Pseudodesulfovibrio cashew]